ncbi:Pycsar system effector family protein [Kitasatospora sp. NPDC058444]|uniref:Pycsar system effector family protein n=1 Tax=Kitasatospora sp. NPDC058444 TaxID=3346504 RepID=UPI003659E884
MGISDPEEKAWRVHTALGEWTTRVDAKAGFALTLESAALAGIVALSDKDKLLSRIDQPALRVMLWLGVLLLLAAAVLAILVVSPRLRAGKVKAEARGNFLYFGHLMHWKPDDLQKAFEYEDFLPVLSHQLVNTSKIVWRKHRFVQHSFAAAGLGALFVFAAWMLS